MKHKIGLDTRMNQHSGIGTYVRGLLSGFSAEESRQLQFFGGNVPSEADSEQWTPFEAPIYSLSEQFTYPKLLKQCDLWHSPHYNVPYFKGKTKLIVTIHDIIHWLFRKQFFNTAQGLYAKTMLLRAVNHSDHIITVSEWTKKDLCEHFGANPNKISVIYEGINPELAPDSSDVVDDIANKYNFKPNYFLYVGLLKPHKNVLWLAKSFSELRRQGKTTSEMVFVGKKDSTYPKGYEEISELEKLDGIHCLNHVAFDELKSLYRNAIALIHPSLYEGFGLTLLESMASGTPVIGAKAGSIPEISGACAHMINPHSIEDLEAAIYKLETNTAYHNELIEKGLAHARKFRWKKTAEETLSIYKKVLES